MPVFADRLHHANIPEKESPAQGQRGKHNAKGGCNSHKKTRSTRTNSRKEEGVKARDEGSKGGRAGPRKEKLNTATVFKVDRTRNSIGAD